MPAVLISEFFTTEDTEITQRAKRGKRRVHKGVS